MTRQHSIATLWESVRPSNVAQYAVSYACKITYCGASEVRRTLVQAFLLKSLHIPIYPWLTGAYPILYLYSVNYGLVRDREVAYAIVSMLLATTTAFILSGRFLQYIHQRALYLGIVSLTFSMSGHIYETVFMPKSLLAWSILSAMAVIAFVLALHRVVAPTAYARLTAPLNLVSVMLVTLQIITLTSQVIAAQGYAPITGEYGNIDSRGNEYDKVNDSASRPDIYYIIPDSYPSDAWLLSAMNFDNSDFTKALQQRGFVIAPNAQSNYGATIVSLPSTLNMRYFNSNPSDYSDFDYLKWMTANSAVARYLMQLGYTYIQFLSGFVHPSPLADINRDFSPNGPIDYEIADGIVTAAAREGRSQPVTRVDSASILFRQPFLPLYIDTTFLRLIRSRLDKLRPPSPWTPYERTSGERFLATIDGIEAVVAMPEATFTVIHLMKPHYPVHFNEQGHLIDTIRKPTHDEYFADFKFANSRFLHLFDTILQGSKNQPVIIFQADHGSVYGEPTTADREMLHFDIYAAYYLPDSYQVEIPNTLSLVNTFPLILNEVFEADFDIRENRRIELVNYEKPFLQRDVTAELARSQ